MPKKPTFAEKRAVAGYTTNKDGSVNVPTRDVEESGKLIRRHYLNRIIWVPELDENEVFAEDQ